MSTRNSINPESNKNGLLRKTIYLSQPLALTSRNMKRHCSKKTRHQIARRLTLLGLLAIFPCQLSPARAQLAAGDQHGHPPSAARSERIRVDQLGAIAGQQYQGDGLTATPITGGH